MVEAFAGDVQSGRSQQRSPPLTGCIYALIDPRDHAIFYVGQTRDLDSRKRSHFAGGHSVSGAKIKVLRSNGLLPLVVVLEADLPLRRLGMAESFWIALLRRRGCALLNVPSEPDARRQLREAMRSDGFGAPRTAPVGETPSGEIGMPDREYRRQQRVRDLGLPLNTGKPWTLGEDAVLQALFRRGLRAGEIAPRFGRSRDAVAMRLARMGLSEERRPPVSPDPDSA